MGRIRLYNQDCLITLRGTDERYDCIFLDPVDNIGLKYDGFTDRREDYYEWLMSIVQEAIVKSNVTWLSYNANHDLEIKSRLVTLLKNNCLTRFVRTFIWRYTFGQYRTKDCVSGYRPILRIARADWTPCVDKIRVPSKRMKIGDPRAAGLRVPDDVFDFPRIVGNSQERRAWHPTQHPEALIERIYLMSGGSRFFDAFAGTGTSIRVCKKLGFDLDICEISEYYCHRIMVEHPGILT